MHLFPLLVALLAPSPAAEPAASPVVGTHIKGDFIFDWTGKDAAGAADPRIITRYEFGFASLADGTVGPTIIVGINRPGGLKVGEVRTPYAEALKGVPAGEYRIYARSVDVDSGLFSPWSNWIQRTVVVVSPPGSPQNLRAADTPATLLNLTAPPRTESVEIRFGGKWLTFKTLQEASRFLQEEADNEQLRRQEQ